MRQKEWLPAIAPLFFYKFMLNKYNKLGNRGGNHVRRWLDYMGIKISTILLVLLIILLIWFMTTQVDIVF